jgi:NADH-quinone oxidoreductase subunit N
MVGFAGKFLLLKSVLETGALHPINYLLVALILTGIIVSIYYYFKVIKAAYWTESDGQDNSPIQVGLLEKITLLACAGFILIHGIYPSWLYQASLQAASAWTWAP